MNKLGEPSKCMVIEPPALWEDVVCVCDQFFSEKYYGCLGYEEYLVCSWP